MLVMMYFNCVMYEEFWYYLFNSLVNSVLALIILHCEESISSNYIKVKKIIGNYY